MPFAGEWCKVWIYFGFVFAWTKGARPRFDTSTDMGLVLVPADAEVDSVIFRLRATDQDADFPLVFEITATITPVVRIDNLPCTLYNKVCQANVILTKRLVPGRLHDFAVRVRDTKGDTNSMQATISVTNATTPRDKIFPHIPSLIMVPEDTKPGKELDYLLVRANSWSGKPVYIELWQPKELFTIRQRQTPTQTRGVITLIGELDFETQSMYTLTVYATDPYTEAGKDTRNIAGLSVVVIVQDVQDVPPFFTLAPPLTRINNSVQPGDTIVRVHAEDGDKGVPREIVYGLVSEGNPFTPFFNISEASGEITLARPLEELTQITHVGAPVVLTVVAEEIRRSREEPPAQATVVDVGFLLGEPGNSPPYFESDNYMATIDENLEPRTVISFGEQYSTKVKDEDIGKAGVFALKLENNNGTFEISPTVAERTANFVISVRDNAVIDYELNKVLSFKIVAQEVGPATNLSASVPVTIFLRDINDNPPVFEEESYEVTLSENVTEGSRVIQVHTTDKDTGVYSSIRYTSIMGDGSEAFTIDSDTGLITVAMGTSLDREIAARLVLSVEARDENGSGNIGVVPLIVNLLDVNDNAPVFEKDTYEFMLNADLTNFTSSAFIKAIDADAETPNNVVRYELIHGNYENKFHLNETSGELILRSPITKIRRKKQSVYDKSLKIAEKEFVKGHEKLPRKQFEVTTNIDESELLTKIQNKINSTKSSGDVISEVTKRRRKRADEDALYTLTARAYDLGVPHLSSATKIRIISGIAMEARIMMFVVPSEQPDSTKTAETLAAITGGRVTVLETRPYVSQNHTGSTGALPAGGKKSIIVARVEQTELGTPLVDVEKIREALAANGVGIIGGTDGIMNMTRVNNTKDSANGTPRSNVNDGQTTIINNTITNVQSEEVTVYKAENKILFWLLIILGLLMLVAIAALIICCICPGCPFYMAPSKRRVHSSETLVVRADGRPKRHLHRQPAAPGEVSWNGRKQAWSADPTRRNWQFNKRNVKNCSLPGDVAYISGQPNDVHAHLNVDAHRLRNGLSYGHPRMSRMNEQERMYMEDVEGQKMRCYDTADSLHQHEMERGSDLQRQVYMQRSGPRYMEPEMPEETTVREQHFYREGNAEVLRLVTRGQMEDTSHIHHSHHHGPTTLIVDGKDIILQRFIEDQNSRHDIEAPRSMESHQRTKEVFQQQQPEIILVPDRLELGHRQHIEEIGPNVQRLVIDHGDYESHKMEKESQIRESLRQEKQETIAAGTLIPERLPMATEENIQANNMQYSFHDLELARQNALLTRLLLEKENRRAGGAVGVDSTSYLETQSLPGQVAIATQTDRTAATQTDRHVRSRSDNDESDEEARHKKKLKSRKKYGDGDWKRTRTLWMKSPIEEEGGPCFDKRLSILRKKVKEVKEGRNISLEPKVLREISDSLDGNGSSGKREDDQTKRRYKTTTEQTGINYKVLNEKENGSLSSEEMQKAKRQNGSDDMADEQKMNVTESTSSSEIKVQREKRGRERVAEKSPKKEAKSKTQKKSGGVIKPRFKILEKELTMLTRKFSKLGDKKFQESTGSDSTSQDKSEPISKELKKDSDQKSSKKEDTSISHKQTVESVTIVSKPDQKGKQKKESAIAKTKQKLKYQQAQLMSTGSSEYDDTLDMPKKSGPTRQETVKPKQSVSNQSHMKLKRTSQADRRELRRQISEFRDEESDKRKDGPAKDMAKGELKPEKVDKGKVSIRATKLAGATRRNLSEETSTSTEERKSEKGMSSFADFEKKSNLDLSKKGTSSFQQVRQAKAVMKKVIDGFSDDFVENLKMGSAEEKTATSTEEEQIADAKIVTKQDLGTTGKITLATGGLEQFGGMTETIKTESVEERIGMEKLTDRFVTSLGDEQELNKVPIKEEELSESKGIIRDQTIDKVMLSEVEITKAEESKQHEEAGTKSIHEETIKQHVKGQIEEYKPKYKSASQTKSGTVESTQENYPQSDKPSDDTKRRTKSKSEDELHERKQKYAEQGDLSRHSEQKAEEILTDVKKKDEPIAKLEKMDVKRKMEKISTEKDKEDSPVDIDKESGHHIQDKGDIKQETKNEFEIFARGTSNGKMSLVQKIEEPVQEYVKTELQSDIQQNITQTDIHITDKKEGKQMEDTTVPYVDDSTKEEKEDVIKVASNVQKERTHDLDKKEVPREDNVSVTEPEETIFLNDQQMSDGSYESQDKDRKSKTVDRIEGSTPLDKDEQLISKEEATAKKATEAQKINIETAKRHKIVEEPTGAPKVVEKPTEPYKTTGESTEVYCIIVEEPANDHQIVEKYAELYKEDEKPTEYDKIVGEPTESFRIVEVQTEDCKTDEDLTVNQYVVEEPMVSHKLVEDPAEADKIIAEPTEIHKLVGEPTASHKIVDAPTVGHKIAEEVIEDSKICEETIENYNVTKKVPIDHKDATDTTTFSKNEKVDEDEKKTLKNLDDDRISDKENIILDEEKDSSKGATSIAEKKTDEQNISVDKEETVHITSDDVNEKKSASLDKPEVSPKKETIAGQAEKEHISFEQSSKVLSDENTQGVVTGSNIVDEHVIKLQNYITKEKTKEVVTEAETIDSETNKIETVPKVQESVDDKGSGNENFGKAQNLSEDLASDKDTVPEISKTEEHTISETSKTDEQEHNVEKEERMFIIHDHYDKENLPLDTPISISEKQETQEPKVTLTTSISTNGNMAEETIEPFTDDTNKKERVLSDVFKVVHSLVGKFKSDKKSGIVSSETETGKIDHPVDTNIVETEVPSLNIEDKDKNTNKMELLHSNASTSLQMNDEASKFAEEKTIDTAKGKTTYPTDDKPTSDPKDNIVKKSPINDILDQKEKEECTEINKTPKQATETPVSKQSIETEDSNKSSTIESVSPTKEINENLKDREDVTKEILKATLRVDEKPEKVLENETIDGKLSGTTEKQEQFHEPPSKGSSSPQNELTGTSLQTSKTTGKEQFPLDSIISETPADSEKILRPEKRLTPVNERTDLQEVEQFVGEETFIPDGNKIQPLPGEQSRTESDASVTVSRDETIKQDLTKENMEETVPLKEDLSKENMNDGPVEEQYSDVSLPLFSSVVVDDSDDSDSSSDISRKTTLTTRPYQTPRHHAREFPEREDGQAMDTNDSQSIGDEEEETLTLELFDDKKTGNSKTDNQSENIEGITYTPVEETLPTKLIEKVDRKAALSETDSKNLQIPVVKEKTAPDSESSKNGKQVESKYVSGIDENSPTAAARLQGRKLGSEAKHQDRTINKNAPLSVSKLAKAETSKVADRRMKEWEKKRVPSQRKKKTTSEESSEEKVARSQGAGSQARYRTRKKTAEEQLREKDSEQTRQSRRIEEESRRKQSQSKLKSDKDKKSSSSSEAHQTPPKTGEIDTSKAQPKYMAWYKKNREEMERKRAELMATDDEEQLPRWLRRSMRNQKAEKEEKQAKGQKSIDTTPRMKRKVKPLVNVESEQLKAIVRQGRKLRKAEGGKTEDPPVQIFATTPPAVSQTDLKHHLVQHSEYKYEKTPAPFYLHPPPAPHPSPQLSPEHFDMQPSMERGRAGEDFDSSIAVSLQGGNRLRHQQLLEKKSVFDIAYSEAAPSQLRSDSITPPS